MTTKKKTPQPAAAWRGAKSEALYCTNEDGWAPIPQIEKAIQKAYDAGYLAGRASTTFLRPAHLPGCRAHDNDYGDEGDRWTCAPGCPVRP